MSTDLIKAGGALAIRPDQTDWTPAQQAVLQQSGIDNQVTAAELSAFLHLCQRTRLDPFSRQIYLIGRWDSRQQRKVYTPQTSIDGYRVVAHRVVAEQNVNLGYEDTLWCDQNGQWRDVWLSDAPPSGVKVTVVRNGQRFPAVALFREYVQTGKENKPIGLWGKMPAGQLAKCAEALALRKAFPQDLAGVYTAEEMAQADNPADERHLRSVQPGESDPWATPAPEQGAEFEPHTEAQALAKRAAAAQDRFIMSALIDEAKRHLPADAQILAPDTEKPDTLRDYLGRRWAVLPKPSGQGGGEQREDDIPDAVTVPEGETEADIAERHLRSAAAAAGLTELDTEFERSYGLPIREAGAQQMREMTRILTGSAA